VVNKLIVQMNSKVSGTPWVVSDIPLRDVPTMVVGIDMFKKRGGSTVVGFCATVDPFFCRYTSFPKMSDEGTEMAPLFRESIVELLNSYKRDNNQYP
jgi:hypothetical protein